MRKTYCAAALLLGSVATPALAQDCAALSDVDLRNVEISQAAAQQAGALPPDAMSEMTGASNGALEVGAHCLVEGKIEDREGVEGRYGIRFQLRMPDDWNGRFLFQGGGGMDGFVSPAIGSAFPSGSNATPALARGYAVVSMDGGHEGRDAAFAVDQQARLDLAYASTGKVTEVAKTLIARHYGQPADRSVFMGCSNGGREAMMAAQRYPLEFDGIVAGNPGFHLSRASLTQAWDVQALRSAAPEGRLHEALTQDDLDTVADEILAQCDAADGLEDGIVAKSCDFDPEALRGQIADTKLDALMTVMQGPEGADGEALYSDWPWDPGMASDGWRSWKLGTEDTPARNVSLGLDSLAGLFMTPPRDTLPDPLDFDALAQNVSSVGGYYDADEVFLSTFAARGGKMVIFQGMADPVFSANDIARWQEAVSEITPDTTRLFMVPGMTHCGGGTATFEDFDALSVLEEWLDTDEAPETMIAAAPELPDREMPLCAYPLHAEFVGGDENDAASFTCSSE